MKKRSFDDDDFSNTDSEDLIKKRKFNTHNLDNLDKDSDIDDDIFGGSDDDDQEGKKTSTYIKKLELMPDAPTSCPFLVTCVNYCSRSDLPEPDYMEYIGTTGKAPHQKSIKVDFPFPSYFYLQLPDRFVEEKDLEQCIESIRTALNTVSGGEIDDDFENNNSNNNNNNYEECITSSSTLSTLPIGKGNHFKNIGSGIHNINNGGFNNPNNNNNNWKKKKIISNLGDKLIHIEHAFLSPGRPYSFGIKKHLMKLVFDKQNYFTQAWEKLRDLREIELCGKKELIIIYENTIKPIERLAQISLNVCGRMNCRRWIEVSNKDKDDSNHSDDDNDVGNDDSVNRNSSSRSFQKEDYGAGSSYYKQFRILPQVDIHIKTTLEYLSEEKDPEKLKEAQVCKVLIFDIETSGLDETAPNAQVCTISQVEMELAECKSVARLFNWNPHLRDGKFKLLSEREQKRLRSSRSGKYGDIYIKNVDCRNFDSEKNLLIDWEKRYSQFDADIICGHNIYGFDLNYILVRAEFHRLLQFRFLGRTGSRNLPIRKQLYQKDVSYHGLSGRIQADTMFFLSAFDESQTSYSLENCSDKYLTTIPMLVPSVELPTSPHESKLVIEEVKKESSEKKDILVNQDEKDDDDFSDDFDEKDTSESSSSTSSSADENTSDKDKASVIKQLKKKKKTKRQKQTRAVQLAKVIQRAKDAKIPLVTEKSKNVFHAWFQESFSENDPEFFTNKKGGVEGEEIFEHWKSEDYDKRLELTKYCMKDSLLTARLFHERMVYMKIMKMGEAFRASLQVILSSGKGDQVFPNILYKMHKKGIFYNKYHDEELDPFRELWKWKPYPGGLCRKPMKKKYDQPVAVFDFAGQYPAIMMLLKVCHQTVIPLRLLTPEQRKLIDDKVIPHTIMTVRGGGEINEEEKISNAQVEAWQEEDRLNDEKNGIISSVMTKKKTIKKPLKSTDKRLKKKVEGFSEEEEKSSNGGGSEWSEEVVIIQDGTGYMFEIQEEMKEWRKQAKSRMKAAKDEYTYRLFDCEQLAYKLYMNGTYGLFAPRNGGKYTYLLLAAIITQVGRQFNLRAGNFIINWPEIKPLKPRIVYGDTDSVMITFDIQPEHLELFKTNPKEYMRIMFIMYKRLEIEVTKSFKSKYIEIELEKIFMPLVLYEKKKNYVGIKWLNPKDGKLPEPEPKPTIVGGEGKKRDRCEHLRKLYSKLVALFLQPGTTVQEIQDVLNIGLSLLAQGKVPMDQMVIIKGLSKAIEEYKDKVTGKMRKIPHVRVAKQNSERKNAQGDYKKGIRIAYVVWTDEKKYSVVSRMHVNGKRQLQKGKSVSDYCEDFKYALSQKKSIDYYWYICEHYKKTLKKLLSPFSGMLDIDELWEKAERIALRYSDIGQHHLDTMWESSLSSSSSSSTTKSRINEDKTFTKINMIPLEEKKKQMMKSKASTKSTHTNTSVQLKICFDGHKKIVDTVETKGKK